MRRCVWFGILYVLIVMGAVTACGSLASADPGVLAGHHGADPRVGHESTPPQAPADATGDPAPVAGPAPGASPAPAPPGDPFPPTSPVAPPPGGSAPAPGATTPPVLPGPGSPTSPLNLPERSRIPGMAPEGSSPMPDEALIVRSIEIRGNQEVPTSDVLAVVTSKIGEPADNGRIQRDLANIYDLGFFTDVKLKTEAFAEGVKIIYQVLENPQVKSIVIEGNKIVPTDKLKGLMATRTGKILNTKTLFADITVINRYYDNELGYLLEPTHVTHLNFNPAEGALRMQITEGIVVQDIKITGNTVVKTPMLRPLVRMKVGQLFNQFTMKEDSERLAKFYEGRDYILDNIKPSLDKARGVVSYQVVEASVEEIKIEGNTRTRAYVIRRLMRTKVGSVLKRSRLQHDYERLNSSGFFESLNIEPEPGSEGGKVVLVLKVKEQKTGMATLGLGYSGGGTGALRSGITGAVSYSERNLYGKGQSVSVSWQRGTQIQSYGVSFFDPAINDAQDSMGISFYRSELSELRQAVLLTDGSTGYSLYNSEDTGGSITYGKYVSEYWRMFLAFKKDYLVLTQASDSPYPVTGLGTGSANSLTLSALHDTRDDLYNPHKGSYFNGGYSVTGGLLGGNWSYTKIQGEGRYYLPLTKGGATLATRLWGGVGNGNLPTSEIFYIGGADTLRGYQENQFVGTRFVVANAEYRFPIANLKMLNGTIFGDAGGAWYPGQTRKIWTDAGVGLRIVFPSLGLGVIRLDYAFGEKGSRSSIGLGQTF